MFVFLEYLERTGTTESKDDNTFKTFFSIYFYLLEANYFTIL